jgi:hypothetical protein
MPTSQRPHQKEIAHNNLRVYIVADKFGTYPLKKLAKDRLVSWAGENWRDEGFPDAVKEIIQDYVVHTNLRMD